MNILILSSNETYWRILQSRAVQSGTVAIPAKRCKLCQDRLIGHNLKNLEVTWLSLEVVKYKHGTPYNTKLYYIHKQDLSLPHPITVLSCSGDVRYSGTMV